MRNIKKKIVERNKAGQVTGTFAETNGYWTYKDGQKDDYTVVKVSLDIKPINLVIQ